MSCNRFAEAIGDSADRPIDSEARAPESDLERHLEACVQCRTLLHDLRQVREAASRLERLTPSPQVWARISEQLLLTVKIPDAGQASRLANDGSIGRAAFRAVPLNWGLAAALVLAVVGAVWLARRPDPSSLRGPSASTGAEIASHREPVASVPPARSGGELIQSVEMELQLAEQHYERAIAGLERIAGAEGSALDAQTAETLQKNLAVIDQAIGESRAALRSQPSSQPAQESLFEAFRTKVALLQEAVALINEMRKGNQAETARIVGDLSR